MTFPSRLIGLGVTLAFWALLQAQTPAPVDGEPAASIEQSVTQVLTIGQVGGLEENVEQVISAAAERFGARWATFHRGTLRLVAVERGRDVVQEAPAGFSYPMSTTAVDARRAAPIVGDEAAAVLARGGLVFGETSAGLRGAEVGDLVTLIGWDGATYQFEVGAVVDDELLGWAELALDDQTAAEIGFVRQSYVAVWDYATEDELLLAMWSRMPDVLLTIDAYFDPVDPDAVLPTVVVKELFGEFAYRPTSGDRVVVDPEWRAENIVNVNLPHLGPFRCHRAVVPMLEGALDEIEAAGLAWMIDYSDFQIAGGCYSPRLIRGGDKGGAVSRHTWGIAIDINPSDNPYGGVVRMDSRIGEIFRKWGFAWGAGWRFPDGGHFEWTHQPTS